MCEANAYLIEENGEEKLILECVDKLQPDGDKLILENIFGQKKIIQAHIKELSLVDHKIVLEK
jgi:predicted RNA-binding protein